MPSGKAENLHNKLNELRNLRGLTQEELADAAKLTRQTIIAIEKGRFTPSVYTALVLARCLGAVVEDIFWITDLKEVGS